jgi:hypothetical protein
VKTQYHKNYFNTLRKYMGQFIIGLILLALRVFGAYFCSQSATEKNRNSGGWGFFGFLSPIVAIIWISLLKPKTKWEDSE